MQRKHAFGTTPWGRYFVEAMEGLADEGRLSRGRAYAGNERVAKLEIESGAAEARVRGNYRPFYSVRIAFPPLARRDAATLAAMLEADTLAVARIRSGDFPPELLDRVKEAGIELFPRRWSLMKRSCDCPDQGDPCKHEAAVYYLIAQEIDRDPSVLFTLRGIDISSLVDAEASAAGGEGRGLADPLALALVPSWDEAEPASFPAMMPPIASYAALLPRILPSGPALAGADLRTALAGFYHALAREWERPLEPSRAQGRAGAGEAQEIERRRLAGSEWRVLLCGSSCSCRVGGREVGLLETVRMLLACDAAAGSRSYEFLRRFSLAMRSIVAACAFHPAVAAGSGALRAVWKPARFGEDVRGALDWVAAAALPPEMEGPPLPGSPRKRGRPPKGGPAPLMPDRRSFVGLLAVAFLGEYVAALGYEPPGSIAAASPVSKALFAMREQPCGTPALRTLPRALAARLAVYDLAARRSGFELVAKRSRDGRAGGAAYRLSASVEGPEGCRYPLHKAGAALGAERSAELLAFPALLSGFVPSLATLGTRPGAPLSEEELQGLVVEAAPLLGRLGVSVVLPRELERLARPRPVLVSRRKGAGSLASVLDLGSAFAFEWKIALGGELIDPREFAAMVAKASALFRFKGEYVRLDPSDAAAILERIAREPSPDALGAVKAALAGEVEEGGELVRAVEFLLAPGAETAARGSPRPVPSLLEATLRPYQERGFRWLMTNLDRGFGCLLADDMGLGKTVQAIAAMLALKEEGRLSRGCIVVSPASLVANWERELARFAPSLSVHTHYGARRRLAAADLVLTTYDTFQRDLGSLGEREWDLAVIDEAHYAKNPDSRRTRAVKSLRAARRLALTGTPVENNLAELWSVIDFALPGYLGGLARFAGEYRVAIEVDRSAEAAERLRRITSPFILRRLKTDREIAPDLPDKIVIQEYASLTAEQVALYRAAAEGGLERIEAAEGIERRGLVLALITALKQIANHPRNWDKESSPAPERSGKARLLLALLDSAMEAGERVLVFSQYVEMLEILRGAVRRSLGVEPYLLHGGMKVAQRDEEVRRFQTETGPGVFLVSLKAGGVGLNLTAATRVFHYDLWFNPAVENQATDRAFRIGQTKNVFVHRLVTRGTLEEKIDAALQSKRELAELTVGAGETWITELSNRELREIVSLARGY